MGVVGVADGSFLKPIPPGVVKVTPSLLRLALRPLAQPACFVTWWGGDSEGEGGGGSFIQPRWPRSSVMKQFCSHLRYYEVTLFLKAFCTTLSPHPPNTKTGDLWQLV